MDGQELGRVKVNFRPLRKGWWEGTYWKDDQEARASNDFSIESPLDNDSSALQWTVLVDPGLADPETEQNSITFNVSWDQPGDDPVLAESVGNGRITNLLTTKKTPGDIIGLLYIAHPRNATRPFTVVISGVQSAQ